MACKFSRTMETAGAIVMPADIARRTDESSSGLWSRYACSATVNTYAGFQALPGAPVTTSRASRTRTSPASPEAQRYVFLPPGSSGPPGARCLVRRRIGVCGARQG